MLTLLSGVALAYAGILPRQWKIITELADEWKDVPAQKLKRSTHALYKSSLVSEKENHDGTVTIALTKNGKKVALRYRLENMFIPKPKKWDGKWRLVLFDIPEKLRKSRDSFRFHLRQLGFFEYQKSSFIYPYPCDREVDYLREFWRVKPFVRFLIVEQMDNEPHLRNIFDV